jgi:hypothetical protein
MAKMPLSCLSNIRYWLAGNSIILSIRPNREEPKLFSILCSEKEASERQPGHWLFRNAKYRCQVSGVRKASRKILKPER